MVEIKGLLAKAMTAESLRHTVISNNIANVNTPYFKRSDIKFESELKRALNSQKSPYPIKALMTDPRHIPFHQPKDINKVHPKINLEYETSYRNDKNNVDIDKEMVDVAKSSLRYNAYASILGRYFKKMNMVLRG